MRRLFAVLVAVVAISGPALAVAEDGGSSAADASASDGSAASIADQVDALIRGELDVAVAPGSLFDIDLRDEGAVQIERLRLRAALTDLLGPGLRPAADAGIRDGVDPERWRARVELDRARLAFYTLSPERRVELLSAHERRRLAAQPPESAAAIRERIAKEEQQRAIDAAKLARSEAEKLVSEELARLIGLERDLDALRARLAEQSAQAAARRDAVIGWQRRVREIQAGSDGGADATYDALRRALKSARDAFDLALDELDSARSEVPSAGTDPLAGLPPGVASDAARERRKQVERAIGEIRALERGAREERAAALLDEIIALNRERLGLLSSLSLAKRGAITGFTGAGWDQARAEARHLMLVLRYHRYIAWAFARSWMSGGASGVSIWRAAATLIPLTLAALALVSLRRRTPAGLALAVERLAHADRLERRVTPSAPHRAAMFLARVHRPLEWLLWFGASAWLLPAAAWAVLEIQLIASIALWTIIAALVIDVINALAASAAAASSSGDDQETARLRLRSLRLVGWVVVLYILILTTSARLVGEGTAYSWVLSTCWLAGIPVFLVLVRWWRAPVFSRVARARKKTPVQAWVLANRTGWKSFLAAMIGAVGVFGLGTIRAVRLWLSRFDLARRAHAYLFKRELDRLAGGKGKRDTRPLDAAAFEALCPDVSSDVRIACDADETIAVLAARVSERRGGVIAIVGARGMGKSTTLRELVRACPGARAVQGDTVDQTRALFAEASDAPPLVALDDAQGLVRPVIGGLERFDDLLSFARANSAHTLWVLAIDAALWPLIQRARDGRPLFERVVTLAPWDERQIGALLAERSAGAGVKASFEDLLETLPLSADEIDHQDALAAREEGYVRMLWDHVRGNPGMALEAWRASLSDGASGTAHVRALQVPDATPLEVLPDSALFILRAVLQLAPARPEDVAAATRVGIDQVLGALRYGEAQGYLTESDGRVRVTWRWLRPIMRLLERRHLLVPS